MEKEQGLCQDLTKCNLVEGKVILQQDVEGGVHTCAILRDPHWVIVWVHAPGLVLCSRVAHRAR